MKLSDMKRNGQSISKKEQAKALRTWFSIPNNLTLIRLCTCMNRSVSEFNGSSIAWPNGRNADALLQKLRKSGVIEFGEGKWHLTDDYADNIAQHINSWL